MFQFSQAELNAQLAALPTLMQFWLNWMKVVIVLMPLLFIRRPQGRIAIGSSMLLIAIAMPVSSIVGISNLLSLIHLLIWTPLVAYFCFQLRAQLISKKTFFGVWAMVMVATAIISLVFDVRDFTRWVLGERGVVTLPADFQVPWISVTCIVLALLLAAAYIFRKLPPLK